MKWHIEDIPMSDMLQDFTHDDASKEAAFQEAVQAVQQAASEQELDEQVMTALGSLDM